MTNKDTQVGDLYGFDEGTCCFAISNKVVRTRTDERALAAGGAKCQAK